MGIVTIRSFMGSLSKVDVKAFFERTRDEAVRWASVWRSRNGSFGCSCVHFEPSVYAHLTQQSSIVIYFIPISVRKSSKLSSCMSCRCTCSIGLCEHGTSRATQTGPLAAMAMGDASWGPESVGLFGWLRHFESARGGCASDGKTLIQVIFCDAGRLHGSGDESIVFIPASTNLKIGSLGSVQIASVLQSFWPCLSGDAAGL